MSPSTSVQLMTDAVIAEYIHEISVRHGPRRGHSAGEGRGHRDGDDWGHLAGDGAGHSAGDGDASPASPRSAFSTDSRRGGPLRRPYLPSRRRGGRPGHVPARV